MQLAWCKLVDDGGRRLLSYDPSRGVTLEGFVSIVVQRQLIDLTRNRADREQVAPLEQAKELPDRTDSPEQRAIHAQQLRSLRKHLDGELPDRGRLILRMLYDDMSSEEEVAGALNVSLQVVANWKHRIKAAALLYRKNTESGEEKKISAEDRMSAGSTGEIDGR